VAAPEAARGLAPRPEGERLAAPEAARGLVPRPESVKIAREFTATTLRRWGMSALSEEAGLVVSELVTNALWHGLRGADDRPCPQGPGSPDGLAGADGPACGPDEMSRQPIMLRLLAQPPYLMCMVTDPSREIPLRRDADPAAETGRGLLVIESCCTRWGWHLLDEGGKVVWALLRSQ
jgi:hypothetical protein